MSENPPRRLTPFVLGAVIGTVAGLLLAPKAGRETRKDVQSWLKRGREKSRLVAQKLRRLPVKKDQLLAAIRAGREALRSNHNGHRRAAVHA